MSEEKSNSNFYYELKQLLIEQDLYEVGMTIDDMQQVLNTLNQSKETANQENELRKLMKCLEDSPENITLMANGEEMDTFSIQENDLEEEIETETIESRDEEIECDIYHPLSIKVFGNCYPPFYMQPKLLQLPLQKRAFVIVRYLEYHHKNIEKSIERRSIDFKNPVAIFKKSYFKSDLEEDELEPSTSTAYEETKSFSDSFKDDSSDFRTTRSGRPVKKINYSDMFSSVEDIDPLTTSNKKLKSSDSTITSANHVVDTTKNLSSKIDWLSKSNPHKKNTKQAPLINNEYNKTSKTDQIFDELLRQDDKHGRKTPTQNLQNIDLSDSDEEMFPVAVTTFAKIHKEQTPDNKPKNIFNDSNQSEKKRISRKLSLELEALEAATEEVTTPELENEAVCNFYGKSKQSKMRLRENNNNITDTDEMVPCPICNEEYSSGYIEYHAARCDSFRVIVDKNINKFCEICNKYFSFTELESHRADCLLQLNTNAINERQSTSNTTKRINRRFACPVCKKLVTNESEMKHAEHCIAVVGSE